MATVNEDVAVYKHHLGMNVLWWTGFFTVAWACCRHEPPSTRFSSADHQELSSYLDATHNMSYMCSVMYPLEVTSIARDM